MSADGIGEGRRRGELGSLRDWKIGTGRDWKMGTSGESLRKGRERTIGGRGIEARENKRKLCH